MARQRRTECKYFVSTMWTLEGAYDTDTRRALFAVVADQLALVWLARNILVFYLHVDETVLRCDLERVQTRLTNVSILKHSITPLLFMTLRRLKARSYAYFKVSYVKIRAHSLKKNKRMIRVFYYTGRYKMLRHNIYREERYTSMTSFRTLGLISSCWCFVNDKIFIIHVILSSFLPFLLKLKKNMIRVW